MKKKNVTFSGQCEHKTRAGTRCRANVVNRSSMCFAHDPALAEKRTAARRLGGQHKRRPVLGPDSPEISLRSGSDVPELVCRLVNFSLRDQIDPKVANSVGGLLNIFLRAHTTEVLEQRLAALEAAQITRPQRSPSGPEGAE